MVSKVREKAFDSAKKTNPELASFAAALANDGKSF